MPPKQKITREMLLQIAMEIVEKDGIDAVTARSVAKAANCSIQPVFSQFATMEELKQATYDYVCQACMKEVLQYEQEPDFFPRVSSWMIDVATSRPHLYQLIYLSNRFRGNQMLEVLTGFESNRRILEKMEQLYGLPQETCKDVLMRSFLILFGITTMICVNHMEFSKEQVAAMMKQTVSDFVKGGRK